MTLMDSNRHPTTIHDESTLRDHAGLACTLLGALHYCVREAVFDYCQGYRHVVDPDWWDATEYAIDQGLLRRTGRQTVDADVEHRDVGRAVEAVHAFFALKLSDELDKALTQANGFAFRIRARAAWRWIGFL
jgi:hypothetical protein